jgi:hypothetical protein
MGEPMSDKKDDIVRIDLTPPQSAKIKAEAGRSTEAIELMGQELEERITPWGRLAANRNETWLIDHAA